MERNIKYIINYLLILIVVVYTFYQVKEESIKSRFDGKIIKGMMDIQLVIELKDSLHNYDGGLAIERRDSRRIKY